MGRALTYRLLMMFLLVLLRTGLPRLTRRRRLYCVVEVGAKGWQPAALAVLPMLSLTAAQLLSPTFLKLIELCSQAVVMLRRTARTLAAGLPVCSEHIRPTPAGSSAR